MTDEVGAAPEAGQAAPEGGAVTSWTDGFNDDLRGYVDGKGFKDASALADSYQNLEKLRGVPAENLMQFPSDPGAEGAMDPIYAKMGRPDAVDGYTNALGDGFPADIYTAAAERAHQLGLGDGQFQGMQQVMAELGASLSEQNETEAATAFDAWKADNSEGFNNAAKVMANVGMTEESIAAMLSGDKTAIYDFAAKVGARSSEGEVVMGDQPKQEGFGMSASAAKGKVAELMGDDTFMKAYISDNKMIRQPAIERMAKLQELAAKG